MIEALSLRMVDGNLSTSMDLLSKFVLQLTHSGKMVKHRGYAGQRMWVITGTEVLDINNTTAAWSHAGR